MTSQTDKGAIDVRNILAGVITAAIVSAGSFVWFLGGVENRVSNLEKDSGKVDQILTNLGSLKEQVAVMNTDITYVKENVRDLKVNSTILSDDVRKLRNDVSDIQRDKGANNGR